RGDARARAVRRGGRGVVGLRGSEGRTQEARALFDEGFEVADLREGDESIGLLWARLDDAPLPARHDFRMRPGGE
ncbi:DUF5107 domain-containing protein, partial [Streptomyces olivaceus]